MASNHNTLFIQEGDGFPTSKGSSYSLPALSTQESGSVPTTNTACYLSLASKQQQVFNFGTIQPSAQLQPLKVPTNYFKGTATMCRSASITSDSTNSSLKFDSGTFPVRSKEGGIQYTTFMVDIYRKVAAVGLPNFIRAQIPVLTNFNLKAWADMAVTTEELQVGAFLSFEFPAGFEGPVPSTSSDNHSLARVHPLDIAHYITKEIGHGALLGPFDHPPFTSWCQVNPLLAWPKKDSTSSRVIMDLSWPLPPGSSVNEDMLTDTYISVLKKMRLPLVQDMASLMRPASKGAWLFSCDVSQSLPPPTHRSSKLAPGVL